MQRSISAFGLSLPVADEPGAATRVVVPDPPPAAPVPAPPPLLGRVPRTLDERWRWDAEGRLTAMLAPGSSQWLHFDHGERGELRIRAQSGHVYLDVADNVARLDNGVVERYGFDAAGRPTRLQATAPSGEAVLDLAIVYDAEGRIVRLGGEPIAYDAGGERVVAAGHAAAAAGTQHDYDARGNRCARRAPGEPVTTYRYDAGDRLVAVERDGRTIVRYGYDEHDRRVRREDGAGTILRHYDPAGNLIAETDEHGTAIATYLCVGVRCLARIDGPVGAPVAAWYHLDHSGSAWAVTDGAAAVVGRRSGPLDVTAPGPYMRRHRDEATGFFDFGARDFDPQTGSFTTPDTYTFDARDPRLRADPRRDPWGGDGPQRTVLSHWERTPQLRDRYAFCLGDAINNVDLDGHSAWWFFLTIPLSLTWNLPNTVIALVLLVLNFIMELVGWVIWPFVALARKRGDGSSYPWGLMGQTGSDPLNPFDVDDRDHFWIAFDASARQGVPWTLFNGSFFSFGRAFTMGNVVLMNDLADTGEGLDTFQRYVVPNEPDVQYTLHDAVRHHEMQHVKQYTFLGPLFHCLPIPLMGHAIEAISGSGTDVTARDQWWQHASIGGLFQGVFGGIAYLLVRPKDADGTWSNFGQWSADFEKWMDPATWWQHILGKDERWAQIATQAISLHQWTPPFGVYLLDIIFSGEGQAGSWFERNAGASSGHTYGTVTEVEHSTIYVGQFTRVICAGGPRGPSAVATPKHAITWDIVPKAPLPAGAPGTGTGAAGDPFSTTQLNPALPVNAINLDLHNNVATEQVVNAGGLYFHATTAGEYTVTGTVNGGESESQKIEVKDLDVTVKTSVFVCQQQFLEIDGDTGSEYTVTLKTNNSGAALANLSYTAGKTAATDTLEIKAKPRAGNDVFKAYGDNAGALTTDWLVKTIDIVVKAPTIAPPAPEIFVGESVDFTVDVDPETIETTQSVPGSTIDVAAKRFKAGRGAIDVVQEETVSFRYACETYTAKVKVKPIAVVATPATVRAEAAATVTATGGKPPYTFEIVVSGSTGPSIDAATGAYKAGKATAPVTDVVTVTDANGGRGTRSIPVTP